MEIENVLLNIENMDIEDTEFKKELSYVINKRIPKPMEHGECVHICPSCGEHYPEWFEDHPKFNFCIVCGQRIKKGEYYSKKIKDSKFISRGINKPII